MTKPDDVSVAAWEHELRWVWFHFYGDDFPGVDVAARDLPSDLVEGAVTRCRAFDAAVEPLRKECVGLIDAYALEWGDDMEEAVNSRALLARYQPGGES